LATRRALAAAGLGGIALIHLLDVEEKLEEVAYIGALFIGLIIVSLILAEALLRADDLRAWVAAGVVAGATIAAYCLSRSVGLPGEGGEEIGKWTEPLGLASTASSSGSPAPASQRPGADIQPDLTRLSRGGSSAISSASQRLSWCLS